MSGAGKGELGRAWRASILMGGSAQTLLRLAAMLGVRAGVPESTPKCYWLPLTALLPGVSVAAKAANSRLMFSISARMSSP
jgi:hypothetical protein